MDRSKSQPTNANVSTIYISFLQSANQSIIRSISQQSIQLISQSVSHRPMNDSIIVSRFNRSLIHSFTIVSCTTTTPIINHAVMVNLSVKCLLGSARHDERNSWSKISRRSRYWRHRYLHRSRRRDPLPLGCQPPQSADSLLC